MENPTLSADGEICHRSQHRQSGQSNIKTLQFSVQVIASCVVAGAVSDDVIDGFGVEATPARRRRGLLTSAKQGTIQVTMTETSSSTGRQPGDMPTYRQLGHVAAGSRELTIMTPGTLPTSTRRSCPNGMTTAPGALEAGLENVQEHG